VRALLRLTATTIVMITAATKPAKPITMAAPIPTNSPGPTPSPTAMVPALSPVVVTV
jgi:hypothetical protein